MHDLSNIPGDDLLRIFQDGSAIAKNYIGFEDAAMAMTKLASVATEENQESW